MIGGGYGFNILSKPAEPPNPVFSALIKQALDEVGAKPEDTFQPDCNQEVFEVEICINQTNMCFAERAAKGIGWEWELSDKTSHVPSLQFELYRGSPTMFMLSNICKEDFTEPPRGEVIDNDDDAALGRQVLLKDLTARKDLNGSIGRVGPWLAERGRYHMCLFRRERAVGHSRVLSSHVL